jgi:hypothetical protein
VPTLRGGVLIIGSLLWDDKENRARWREDNLDIESKFQVYLPIRYGRQSSTRNNTYTMVFSNKCYSKNYGLGKGWIVPIVAEIHSFDELKQEASKIGKTEGFEDGFSSSWGVVAIKFNPYKKTMLSLEKEWISLIASKLSRHQLPMTNLKTEKAAVDSKGFLSIRWPQVTNPGNQIEDVDFLLSTVTKSTFYKGRYPTIYQIANSMKKSNYYDYFLRNRENGIITFQDQRILDRIK